jgi:hypothetical protein
MSCTASGEGLVPGLAWAEGVAEADETGIEARRARGIIAIHIQISTAVRDAQACSHTRRLFTQNPKTAGILADPLCHRFTLAFLLLF